MSITYIVVSIAAGLAILGGIFYVSFLFENQKKRNAMLIAKANDRAQKYQKFLDCFQADVLPKDIKLVLIEEVLFNLKNAQRLNTSDSRTARLVDEAEVNHKDILKSQDKPPQVPKVKDLSAAKEVQLQFKNLFRLLNYIGKTRKIHTKVINKNLKVLQSLFVETGVSVHRSIAEAAATQSKNKLALYHLNQAIGEYARVDAKKFAGQIKELRLRIAAVDQTPKAAAQANNAEPAAPAKPAKKDRGLDRMFDDKASSEAKRNM